MSKKSDARKVASNDPNRPFGGGYRQEINR